MNKKNIIIVIVAVVIIIIFLPLKFQNSINANGKVLPIRSWTVIKGEDGRLITSLMDNENGTNSEYSVIQFERGDAVNFQLDKALLRSGKISVGDTLGRVISNEIEKDLQKLIGELETARAGLYIETSSEKESIINTEKNKLELAKIDYDKQTKIFERKKDLFKKELISTEEYETAEALYEFSKINIDIAEQRLRTVESGEKKEEINLAKAKISSLENRISVLQKRFEKNIILTPFSGVINKTYSSDTLLTIMDTSKALVLMPVELKDIKSVMINSSVVIKSKYNNEYVTGEVIGIENVVKKLNNIQLIIVTASVENFSNKIKFGQIVEANIDCGDISTIDYLINFFQPLFY